MNLAYLEHTVSLPLDGGTTRKVTHAVCITVTLLWKAQAAVETCKGKQKLDLSIIKKTTKLYSIMSSASGTLITFLLISLDLIRVKTPI